jgi:hypothetical protein
MTATYIPISDLPHYLDYRLRDICSAAVLDGFSEHVDAMQAASGKLSLWSNSAHELTRFIEYHGLSGMFYSIYNGHLKESSFHDSFLLQLKGAVVKHTQRWESIEQVLESLHGLLGAEGISFILLKGSALANDIYSKPFHRSMADVDILVDSACAQKVSQLCVDSGFNIFDEKQEYEEFHHLPALVIKNGQHSIFLEIHRQALSTDLHVQITFSDVIENTRQIMVKGHQFFAFGHIDMLRHLCLHTFSRDQVIKLSGVVDLLRYAIKYENEIDWTKIEDDHFHVINTLRCCRILVSLPSGILSNVEQELVPISGLGLGLGMLPLREYRNAELPMLQRVVLIFFPSKWWQHVFYVVSPDRSLFFTRYFRHPLKIMIWGISRIGERLRFKGNVN